MSKHLFIAALLLASASCSTPAEQKPAAPAPPAPTLSATPFAQSAALQPPAHEEEILPPPEIRRGSGRFVGSGPSSRTVAATPEGQTTLNFVNADIADVAKAVLGDLLKLNYLVDATVQGSVTLQTSRPLAHDVVLPAFEQAIRLAGLALVERDGIYRVVPLAEAARSAGPLETEIAHQPGFGVEIVPLLYVGVPEMQKLLEPLAPKDSILRADPARNLLIIAGSERERAAVIENIRLFDVDWMAGMSFAVLPLKSVEPKTVIAELKEVLGGKDGPLGSIVRLVPISRINSILAISPQPKYLDQVADWVGRLDRIRESANQRIYVYYVQNGRASDLAAVLNKVLTGSSQTGAAPGSRGPGLSEPEAPATGLPGANAGSGLGTPSLFDQSRPRDGAPAGSTVETEVDSSGRDEAGAGRRAANIRITADQTTNALLIYATPADYAIVESALAKLDIAPLQVLLEAAVAEVDLTKDMNYGIQYSFLSGSSHTLSLSNAGTGAIAATNPGFNYLFSSGNSISAVLSALQDLTTIKVLSAPEVLVLNNQTATLQVGDQVPIETQSAVSVSTAGAPVVNSIEYKDTGVILKVTPRVNEGGLVLMDVAQEVSDVGTTTTSSLGSPTISLRKVSSTVAVQDGETIALGGLFKDQTTSGRGGVPWLQDIPFAGSLFSSTTNNTQRTELLIMITPHVVQGVQKLRDATEELRRSIPEARGVFDQRPK
jgi:general secretion pathway protein D